MTHGRDARGYRAKIAVTAPSTNTILQPDLDDLRLPGVTNHLARIRVPDMVLASDEDFRALVAALDDANGRAVEDVMTARPDHLLIGVSALSFWGGVQAAQARRRSLEKQTGLGVTLGAFAFDAALTALGAERIAVLSPYFPIMDAEIKKYFEETGRNVSTIRSLEVKRPTAIAEIQMDEIESAAEALTTVPVDALLIVGTNLSVLKTGPRLSQSLNCPVLTANATAYWHALARLGLETSTLPPPLNGLST